MDLTHYKPTSLEKWITKKYQSAGINYPADMDIEIIADMFGIEVHYREGKSFVDWIEDFNFIVIDALLRPEKRREVFFHELGHCLLHCGIQDNMPELFMELQERQATHFQYYAAMPSYMLEEFKHVSPSLLVKTMAEEFMLPERFVERRLDQVKRRIHIGRQDDEMNERMKKPVKVNMDHVRRVMEEFGRRQRERQGAY